MSLPPLPTPTVNVGSPEFWRGYSADQMREFAREFAEAAVAAEREACATMCDNRGENSASNAWDDGYFHGARDCAADIRSRTTTRPPAAAF